MLNKPLLYDLFKAYYDARKNKRNTMNQLDFEINLESNIINLYEELVAWRYEVSRSIHFIQEFPVKREVFAWCFRDRIIHHLVYNYVAPIVEKKFIYDSYSCRIWKGTSLGIKRVNRFIRSCSDNYTKDCYILKLDIAGYFMSINKDILFEKIKVLLIDNNTLDFDFIIKIIEKIIFNDCTKDSIFKGRRDDYLWLPRNKSLFFASPGCWLPIWNLTSQLFSNVYLTDFDLFIRHWLNCKYYGRYVDDFVIIHKDKNYLTSLILVIDNYLNANLWLKLHPKKIYLQHYKKWVLFLWAFIKPHRQYIRKRTVWWFYSKLNKLNKRLENNNFRPDSNFKEDAISTINSYLGMLKQFKSYKLRKKLLFNNVSAYFWNYFYISSKYRIVKRK